MKRKVLVCLLGVVLLACFISCSTIQEKWSALTPDQQARIIIDDLQGQLDNAFVSVKAQIGTKPEWKSTIVPAFDVANKALADVIAIGKTQPLTPELVYSKVQNQINNVLNLCVQFGWIKK
jgi:hypothetical protein